jgi:predicted lysophospholipase L1 biosynthesis ABC-type transport system permease subunit
MESDAPTPEPSPSPSPSVRPLILGLAALLLGAIALTVAITSYGRKPEASTTSALRHRLQDDERAITAVKAQYAQLAKTVGTTGTAQATATRRIAKILACIPELEGQINGLEANVTDGSVYLTNTQQVSSYCSPIVYGNPSGHGD